ncbi:unnamed protein product [Nippostrongylus brasiliensis]|uniref:Secreted protein n=1 Tax=Nippostrongylus brasiliensis TaxID=27835 RepID=A0A0N4XXR6_NIPBR|nr:unnamed protein product [Nippostrongylus brasiliensis]
MVCGELLEVGLVDVDIVSVELSVTFSFEMLLVVFARVFCLGDSAFDFTDGEPFSSDSEIQTFLAALIPIRN